MNEEPATIWVIQKNCPISSLQWNRENESLQTNWCYRRSRYKRIVRFFGYNIILAFNVFLRFRSCIFRVFVSRHRSGSPSFLKFFSGCWLVGSLQWWPAGPFQLSSRPGSSLQLRHSLNFEYDQTLQRILARCDGEHSGALPTQLFLPPTNSLAHFYTQHDYSHCVIELYTPVACLYIPWRNIIGILTHSDMLSIVWISTGQRFSAIWFPLNLKPGFMVWEGKIHI